MRTRLVVASLLLLGTSALASMPLAGAYGVCETAEHTTAAGSTYTSKTCAVRVAEGGYLACIGYESDTVTDPDGNVVSHSETCKHEVTNDPTR